MPRRLADLVDFWCGARGIPASERPEASDVARSFARWPEAVRAPASESDILGWELRHGFRLPEGLKSWLRLSNGLQLGAPFVHPLGAIGPMVPFATMPDVVIQPESWFELGNPNVETICVDLGYRRPDGDFPLFTSGDDQTGSRPRVIAPGFDRWFLDLLISGGREYWFDHGAPDLGDPWDEHRRNVPQPPLNERLRRLAPEVGDLLRDGVDEWRIAVRLGVTPLDVEAITRHLQHERSPFGLP